MRHHLTATPRLRETTILSSSDPEHSQHRYPVTAGLADSLYLHIAIAAGVLWLVLRIS